MKKYGLLLIVLLFVACETGTKYEKNTTKETTTAPKAPQVITHVVDTDDILALIDDVESEPDAVEQSYIERTQTVEDDEITTAENQSFTGGATSDGLDIKSIRKAYHGNYERLVLDSYYWSQAGDKAGEPADKVGHYRINYDKDKDVISVVIEGYRSFSAKFPHFDKKSVIEKVSFDKYLDDSGYKFNIKLKEDVKIRVMALGKPARLVIDIKRL